MRVNPLLTTGVNLRCGDKSLCNPNDMNDRPTPLEPVQEKSRLISVDDALAYVLERARPVQEIETLALEHSLGRIVARTQHADIDVPAFANSSMDGYAIRSEDTAPGGRIELEVTQRIPAGRQGGLINPGEAARIFTGAPLPDGADAIVIQEDCERRGGRVSFTGPVPSSQHVRPRGNNIAAGAEVLLAGARVRPQEVGIAAAVGLTEIPVTRRLRVGFFSSGDELVNPGQRLRPGQIYNSNRYTLMSLLGGLGCETTDLGIVEDSLARTQAVLRQAAGEVDVIITSGGVSVGEEDHVTRAVETTGSLEMWQVAVKPGKPLAYGRIGEADFLGLPGNPVSTLVTFCLFVRPFLLRRQGMRDVEPKSILVSADFDWPTPMRRREYLRVRLEGTGGAAKVSLYHKQGSDVLASTVWADGLVEIPERSTVKPGDRVSYLSFSELLQ